MSILKKIKVALKPAGKLILIYALVGKAGSGKSFRARLVAEKHQIDLIIDDGLLIRDHRILAGKSAKREKIQNKAPEKVAQFVTSLLRLNDCSNTAKILS